MRRIFHVRKFALYAAVIVAWRGSTVVYDGGTIPDGLIAAGILAVVCGFAIGVLAFLAHLVARGTIYTITDRRLVMRFGIALPMTVQIPFRLIEGAAVKIQRDGTGDIPITLTDKGRVSYFIMWPHVRPWRLLKAQPMLRALPDAREAAEILANALQTALDEELSEAPVETAPAKARTPGKKSSTEDERTPTNWAPAAG